MLWEDKNSQYWTFYLDFLAPSTSPRQKKGSMEDLLGHILRHPAGTSSSDGRLPQYQI